MKMFIKVYHGDFKSPGRKLFQHHIAKNYPEAIVVLAHYDNSNVTISCSQGMSPIEDCNQNNKSINDLGSLVDELKRKYSILGGDVIAYIEGNLRNKSSSEANKLTAEAVACLNALKPGAVVFFMGTSECEKHTSFCIMHNAYNLQELNLKNRSVLSPRNFIAEDNTLTVTCEAPSYFFVLNKEQVILSIAKVTEVISTAPECPVVKTTRDITPEQSIANELSAIGNKSSNQSSLGYNKPAPIYEAPVDRELFQASLVRPSPLELIAEKAVLPKPQPRSGYSFGLFRCCSNACSDVVPFATTPLNSTSITHTS